MSTTPPTHLEPSELGTKEYWDTLYTTELQNHASNPQDEGTVWFDDADAESRIVSFLDSFFDPDPESDSFPEKQQHGTNNNNNITKENARILDLGCGNGSLLFSLREAGWSGTLVGVDYSAESVSLARQICRTRAVSETGGIEFRVWDVLNGEIGKEKWDLVLDKGTFDAVSLSGEVDGLGRRVCEGYAGRVVQLLREGGFFLVTSCNWTEMELGGWFDGKGGDEGEGGRLKRVGRIEYPSFSFGGVKGSSVSSVLFEKVR